MHRPELRELVVFAEVARHLNFTRAAAVLNVSLPSLSQTLKSLEAKLGVRLLARTTRSVSLTEAGVQLLIDLEAVFRSLDIALDGVTNFRASPGGRLRILSSRAAATVLVGPLIGPFLAAYPDIEIEMIVDDLHLDLVAEKIDAGIQVGGRIEKDMIAQSLVETFDEKLYASPRYLETRTEITAPQDLANHLCVRLRSQYEGVIRPWVLQKGDEQIEVKVGKRFVANDLRVLVSVTRSGAGIGMLPPVLVDDEVNKGALLPVLPHWASPVSGIHIFYPSRRQISPALDAFISFMRENRPPKT